MLSRKNIVADDFTGKIPGRKDAAPTTKATFTRDGKKHRFFEFVVPPLGGRFDGFRLKAGLRTRSCFLAVES